MEPERGYMPSIMWMNGVQMKRVAIPTKTIETLAAFTTLTDLDLRPKCRMIQLRNHPISINVSLPLYGPMPAAPGIDNFPSEKTRSLNGLDATVPVCTRPSVNSPIAAESIAAAAGPVGFFTSIPLTPASAWLFPRQGCT